MALFWFLLGVVIIFGIGRYNESNKLFWVLLLSFVCSFTVASVVLKTTHEERKESVVQMNPIQGVPYSSEFTPLADEITVCAIEDSISAPVGQDSTSECNTTLHSKARLTDGETVKPYKPPQI